MNEQGYELLAPAHLVSPACVPGDVVEIEPDGVTLDQADYDALRLSAEAVCDARELVDAALALPNPTVEQLRQALRGIKANIEW